MQRVLRAQCKVSVITWKCLSFGGLSLPRGGSLWPPGGPLSPDPSLVEVPSRALSFTAWGPAKPTSCHVGARHLWKTVATAVQPARAPNALDPKAVSSLGAGRKCVTAAPWVTILCCQSCAVLAYGCPGLTVLSLSRAEIEMRKPRPREVKRPPCSLRLEYFRFLGNSVGASILSIAGSSQGSSVCVNVSF